ncbi:hypothetical protein CQ14_26495 [Bradyrhizobium lablabi]|uniref:Uncharacterized protein n=2 Tax=Bradyrhizobium lablabi TaxID=722472 RepID=A0A0R3MRS7_9BRAD|nr:hypothetical protein CQ14_26495 [Bradyrhizobium lablabi]
MVTSPGLQPPRQAAVMTKLDNRAIANMDLALEQACRVFPHGGDHERRRYVAQKLRLSARKGNTTFDGLIAVERRRF